MSSKRPPKAESQQQETLLEFPCKFPVKVMGRNDDGFQTLVTNIILKHAQIFARDPVTTKPSGSGNFISIGITIEAVSKVQLDRIYHDLTDCEQVLVAL